MRIHAIVELNFIRQELIMAFVVLALLLSFKPLVAKSLGGVPACLNLHLAHFGALIAEGRHLTPTSTITKARRTREALHLRLVSQ
jgi:hypothetical protein